MVDTSELESFLSEKSCKENDIVEITGAGDIEEKETQFGMRKLLNLPVEIDGRSMIWTPSKAARTKLSELYDSTRTEDWVGKKFIIAFVTMLIQGKEKRVIMPKKLN